MHLNKIWLEMIDIMHTKIHIKVNAQIFLPFSNPPISGSGGSTFGVA